MATFNPKDLVVNSVFIDNKIIRELDAWTEFYNSCPLMEDLGESVYNYTKTYRVFENNSGLLFSNGIFYDKINDLLFSTTNSYSNWYSKLLLNYNISQYFQTEYCMSNSIQQTNMNFQYSLVIIRNKILMLRGIMDATTDYVITDSDMIDDLKSVILFKNKDTYITQKTEYLFPHEMQYSFNKFDEFTAMIPSELFSQFDNSITEYMSRCSCDITAIANLAAGLLFSAYGCDKDKVIPLFLNMNDLLYSDTSIFKHSIVEFRCDDTNNIIYTAYLSLEYLYDYKYNDQLSFIDVMNIYFMEEYDSTVDIMNYILPAIYYNNGKYINKYEKCFGIVDKNKIFTNKQIYQLKNVLNVSINNDKVNIIFSNVLYKYTLSELKIEFFSLFPDLSTSVISSVIDDITNYNEYNDDPNIYIPILLSNETNGLLYSQTNNIPKLYIFTIIMWNILKYFYSNNEYIEPNDTTHSFRNITNYSSNIIANDISTYISLLPVETRDAKYVSNLLNINNKFNIIPIGSSIFNPSILDEIQSITASILGYGSGNKLGQGSDTSNYGEMNLLDIDRSDINQCYFMSSELSGIEYEIFVGDDVLTIGYTDSAPNKLFVLEPDTDVPSIDDISLSFPDKNKFQYVPVDLEKSNYVEIPYRGLLMLKDILDNESIQLDNIQIQRDTTSNTQMCKIKVLQYDQMYSLRTIKFVMFDDNEISSDHTILYEFGLGFELMSSENIEDLELLRILYIVLDENNPDQNILVEKMNSDQSKLKLIFKKLTDDPILLRYVLGDRDNQEILSTSDNTV